VTEQIIVNHRFCGPPNSGNGGYVCGLLSRRISGNAEVKLLRPIPLDTPLRIEIRDHQHAVLLHGVEPVAEAYPADTRFTGIPADLPVPPAYEQAGKASGNYIGFHEHPFPTCFVCGPQRAEKDGLRIFAGRPQGERTVASTWIPDETLSGADGTIHDEFIWAALDCPGAFAVAEKQMPPIVLGKLAVHIVKRVPTGEKTIVVGWKMADEGRKAYAGTAIFSASGQLFAVGRATWIWLK